MVKKCDGGESVEYDTALMRLVNQVIHVLQLLNDCYGKVEYSYYLKAALCYEWGNVSKIMTLSVRHLFLIFMVSMF